MTHSKLAPNNGNRTHSAEKLGISVRALQKKIALLRIQTERRGEEFYPQSSGA